MKGKKVKYQVARKIAENFVEEIQRYCERMEIVGELRRGKSEVDKIQILIISKEHSLINLFGDMVNPYQMINTWVEKCGYIISKNGDKQKEIFYKSAWVELYITGDKQWGLHKALRTGSNDYARWLVTNRREGGALPGYLKIKDGWLMAGKKKIITHTEEDFYTTIDQVMLPPELRDNRVWRMQRC
jgi:DNA polymerase/3'-5' exonuclease PolX